MSRPTSPVLSPPIPPTSSTDDDDDDRLQVELSNRMALLRIDANLLKDVGDEIHDAMKLANALNPAPFFVISRLREALLAVENARTLLEHAFDPEKSKPNVVSFPQLTLTPQSVAEAHAYLFPTPTTAHSYLFPTPTTTTTMFPTPGTMYRPVPASSLSGFIGSYDPTMLSSSMYSSG